MTAASPATEAAGGRPLEPSQPPETQPTALEQLVALERHRAEAGFAPDPARLAEGWAYRFVADARGAEESAALYAQLGFEVSIDPVGAATSPACDDCRLVALLRFRAIYTRRRAG